MARKVMETDHNSCKNAAWMMAKSLRTTVTVLLYLFVLCVPARSQAQDVVLENLDTFAVNQTMWTVAWREPDTPVISKYDVFYYLTSEGPSNVKKVKEIVSRGAKYFYKVPVYHLDPNTNYTMLIQPCGPDGCYNNVTFNGITTACCGRSALEVHITYPGLSCSQQGTLQSKIRSHIAYPLQARWRQGFCGRSCDYTNRLLINRCPPNAVMANITFLYARETFELFDSVTRGVASRMSSIDAIHFDMVANKAFDFTGDSDIPNAKPDLEHVIIQKTYTACSPDAPMMDKCIGCGAGYYVVGAPRDRLGCRACARGTYQPENHKRQCLPCPTDAKGRASTTRYLATKDRAECFFSPAVDGILPDHGPVAGGTIVRVTMAYFDSNSLKSVTIAGTPCAVIPGSLNNFGFTCKTSSGNQATDGPVVVDCGTIQVVSDIVFHYKNNPDIDSIDFQKTFLSGGMTLIVRGSFMDSVAVPVMQITRRISSKLDIFSTVCEVYNEFSIGCPTPNMTQDFENLSGIKLPSADPVRNRTRTQRSLHTYSETPNVHDLKRRSGNTRDDFNKSLDKIDQNIGFHISGFVLDGVKAYSNFSAVKKQYSQLSVFADPIVYKFTEDRYVRVFKVGREDLLYIEGARLDLGSRLEDYSVQIGLANCTVWTLTTTLLGCKPPLELPETDPAVFWQDYPHIQVQVGSLSFHAGYVEYQQIVCTLGVFCDIKVAGAVIGLVALFITIVAVACVCTMKRRRSQRQPKRDSHEPAQPGAGEVRYRPDTLPKDRGNVNNTGAGNRVTRYSRISEADEEEARANRDSALMKRGSRVSVGSNRNSVVAENNRPVSRGRAPSATEDFTITLPRGSTPPKDMVTTKSEVGPPQGQRKSSLVQKLPAHDNKDSPSLATKLPKRNSQDEGAPVVKKKEKHKRKDKKSSKSESQKAKGAEKGKKGGSQNIDPQSIPVTGNIDLATVFPKANNTQSPKLPAKSQANVQTNIRRNKKRPESEAKR